MAILLVNRRYTCRTGCNDWPSADAIGSRHSSFSEVFRKEDARMTTVEQPGRFATLPDEETLAESLDPGGARWARMFTPDEMRNTLAHGAKP
jgi:hypothetical protein